MLASGADVKIGSFEYQIATDLPDHYVHALSAKDPVILRWEQTDWSEGQGFRIYDPDHPGGYDYSRGGIHGRVPGRLQATPDTEKTNVTLSDRRMPTWSVMADNAHWTLNGVLLAYTQNGTSWTGVDPGLDAKYSNGFPNFEGFTAVAGDDDKVYFAAYNRAVEDRIIVRTDRTPTTATVVSENTGSAYVGLAIASQEGSTAGDRLFAWTGRKLTEYDLTASLPLAATTRFNTGDDPGNVENFRSQWFADCVTGDDGVYFFYGRKGMSRVYRYRLSKKWGEHFWTAPQGFWIQAICFQLGTLFIAGTFGNTAENFSADAGITLYAIPLDTRRPVLVASIAGIGDGDEGSHRVTSLKPGINGEILIGAISGSGGGAVAWIYNMANDSVSRLDTIEDNRDIGLTGYDIGSFDAFGKFKIISLFDPDTTAGTGIPVAVYQNDSGGNIENDVQVDADTLYSSNYDFGRPGELKALYGFIVEFYRETLSTTSGLNTLQQITLAYSTDLDGEGGGYQQLTSIDKNSAVLGARGRVFVPVSTGSSTIYFHRLKYGVYLENLTGFTQRPPIVLSVTALAVPMSYEERWSILIRARQSQTGQRPRNRQWAAGRYRDELEDLVTDRKIVTFLDGFRNPGIEGAQSTSHTCYVERVEDAIDRNAEGAVRVTLRSLTDVM